MENGKLLLLRISRIRCLLIIHPPGNSFCGLPDAFVSIQRKRLQRFNNQICIYLSLFLSVCLILLDSSRLLGSVSPLWNFFRLYVFN